MQKVCRVLLLGLVALAVSIPAQAWEFKLKGDTEWRYRYWTRTGSQDIFGEMNSGTVDLGINHIQTFPTTATTNRMAAGFGVMAGENRYGGEMCWNDYRMTIYPEIKVNPAISVSASVNLTSLGIWSDGAPYIDSTAPAAARVGYVNSLYVPIQDRPVASNVPNTYLTLQWLKWSVKLPFADLSIGYKDSKFGMGLWKHGCNRSSSSFSVSSHYGPLKISFSPYFARQNSAWANFPEAAGNMFTRIFGSTSPARQMQKRNYFSALQGEIEYTNGPFQFALLSDSYREDEAPDARMTARGAALAPANVGLRPSEDIIRYRLATSIKYFDGRFFFYGEADWYNRWRSGRGSANPSTGVPTLTTTAATSLNVRPERDDNAWVYGMETGTVVGPSRIAVSYVRATGNDPSNRFTNEDAATAEQGVSSCVMKEWGYLMYYLYGTGDGWDASGFGQPTNFHHYGLKIDYSAAANLNLRGILSYANRDQPNAYRFGGDYAIQAAQWTNEDLRLSQLGIFRGRPVPDSAREIGTEVDLGFDWKLLENLTWSATFAYWRPGTWWSYAYPNTANVYRFLNGASPTAAFTIPGAPAAANPAFEPIATFQAGRTIDPLFAIETTLMLKF